MRIYLAADHAGFELKNQLAEQLRSDEYEVEDLGAHQFDPDDDYPPLAKLVAQKVSGDPNSRGIMVCGSGEGMAIAANRLPGVRASVVWDEKVAQETRQDNDSNVLALPARSLEITRARNIVHIWLTTPFSKEERHVRRISEIDQEN